MPFKSSFKSILLVVVAIGSCASFAAETKKKEDALVQRAAKPTETGMELFSWHKKGEESWHFALLPAPGNDNLKTVDFVTSKENALDGADVLKKKFAALAPNEKVGWYNMLEKRDTQPGDVVFEFPPKEIIKELELYCTILKVRLNIYQAGAKRLGN
ncbi:MAG: hypothetical protein WCT04_04645 [Planctomycetota bacterium]